MIKRKCGGCVATFRIEWMKRPIRGTQALLGFVVFDTLPTGATVAGGLVILASTLLLARHEARGAPR